MMNSPKDLNMCKCKPERLLNTFHALSEDILSHISHIFAMFVVFNGSALNADYVRIKTKQQRFTYDVTRGS